MITPQKDQPLAHCRLLIEEKLGWGASETWSSQDFEQLSEQLAEQTGVALSATTLKRVWGRVKYDSAPTTTTLNALATFMGYESWRHFQNAQQEALSTEQNIVVQPGVETQSVQPVIPVIRKANSRQRRWVAAALFLGLIGMVAFIQTTPKPLRPADFAFRSQPVTTGIPNSVVFAYDATASPTDSVFIQQSWDPRRRQLVPKNGHQHTSIYYYPGYFRAKLVIGKQIVREHDLLIPSNGWHVAVKQEPVPVYFNSRETIHDGVLQLPLATIQQQNIPVQPRPPLVQYRNVRDFNGLQNSNFVLETRLKNDFNQGAAACQKTNIMILCRNEMLSIPLTAKGCVGDLGLHLAGHEAQSTTTNLAGFGTDLSQWTDVRCEVKNRQVQIFINHKKIYQATIPTAPAEIVGISYNFEGTGSVDYVRFNRPNGEVVFADDFDPVVAVK